MCAWRISGPQPNVGPPGSAERRALGLLLEGVAINQPQIDIAAYRKFRSAILRSSVALVQRQSEADLLQTVASIVREFEIYRTESEAILESQTKEWRQMAGLFISFLGARGAVDLESELWTKITIELTSAASLESIQALRLKLQKLLQQSSEEIAVRQMERNEEQDRSTANDNAAGLRGGGAAIEHVRRMIFESRPGHIGLFRLSCLDVVGERFGAEGIQDCLMAVSAFLIENLRAEDTVYHWSESSLLAVCDRKVREDILVAELNRVLARNRDFNINIGDRTIMLRIPIDLQLFPVTEFSSADDLRQLPVARARTDRALSDRAQAPVAVRNLW